MNTHDKINRLIDKLEAIPAMDFAARAKGFHDLRAAIEADRKRRGEPVKLCDCEKGHNGLGMVGRECDCEASQPAEPVKVPSDADIDAVWRELTGRPCIPGSTAHAFARALLARYGNNKGESNG